MSRGMSMQELGTFVSTTLATSSTLTTTYGISQDGGGSSTMVVNGEVKNYTLCNNADCRHYTFLPLLALPASSITATHAAAAPAPAPTIHINGVDAVTAERYVANGIMMVVVEPMTATTTFTPTQAVETKVRIDLRLGPGS